MIVAKIEDMVKGWFVGDFDPTLYRTSAFEVGTKTYQNGDHEAAHYHAVAREITAIVTGSCRMNGIIYRQGDIIVIEPNEATDFTALEDGTITVVVKVPSVPNDKFLVGSEDTR
jgi:quercetin dioxygenase-like cupin family protein